MPDVGPIKSLTNRERTVLEMIVGGFPAREIALRLGIAPRTVECHVDQLRQKTGSRNRAHMAAVAVRAGLVNPPQLPSADTEIPPSPHLAAVQDKHPTRQPMLADAC